MSTAAGTGSGQRIVTVWWPDWPVVAAGVAAGVPAAVLHANRVLARSPAAAAEGVALGHRRREAQARCPELVVLDHDPARDARAFEPVVRAVGALAPRLDVVAPGWLALDARGPSRYHGGDSALAARLVERLVETVAEVVATAGSSGSSGSAGLSTAGRRGAVAASTVAVGVADGRFASGIAARCAAGRPGGTLVVPRGGSPAFCAGLPVRWLVELGEATPELVGLFARLGLATLGELAGLAAADVLARFGPEGAHAHRLAGGGDERPPDAVAPPPERRVERAFDDPVQQLDVLVFTAKQLADELAAGLAAEGRVCTRLVVVAETDHGERSERAWYRAGGMSAAAMVERVRWQLDGWVAQPGGLSAGVVLVRLVPDEVRADSGDQLGLWGGWSQLDEAASRAVARLSGLVGPDGVRVPAWRGGRLPVERFEWVAAATATLDSPADRLQPGPGPWPGSLPAPAPAAVHQQPIAAELTDAAGQSIRVGGRGELSADPARLSIGGRAPRKVEAWAGPWPVDERWWEPRRHRRLARFQVVTDDTLAHVVYAERRQWWVAASYE